MPLQVTTGKKDKCSLGDRCCTRDVGLDHSMIGAIYVSSSELRIGGTTEFVSNSAYDVIESQGGRPQY